MQVIRLTAGFIMGFLLDKVRTPFGRRKPAMVVGLALWTGALYYFCNPPATVVRGFHSRARALSSDPCAYSGSPNCTEVQDCIDKAIEQGGLSVWQSNGSQVRASTQHVFTSADEPPFVLYCWFAFFEVFLVSIGLWYHATPEPINLFATCTTCTRA